MLASIVIATYNEEKYLNRLINSLENQTVERENYEIILIDGGSKDKTREYIGNLISKYKNIKMLENPNKIQSFAFNMGIREAASDYVFILGAHSEYPDTFIEKSLESIKKENVDCVGGKIIMKGTNKLGDAYGVARNTPFGGGLSPYRYSTKKQLVETVAFGCYRRETLLKVNGYNEALVKNQDNDLNKRIIQAGGKIMFDPDIYFYYFTRDSIKGIYNQLYNYGYWEAVLIKQQKEQFSIATIVPSLFVVYTVIALAMAVAGSFILLAVEFVPYLLVFALITAKYIIPRKQNVFMSLFLFLLIHSSIGIGFLLGLVHSKER